MKATTLKRGSRKKQGTPQQTPVPKEERPHPPSMMPQQQQQQQQLQAQQRPQPQRQHPNAPPPPHQHPHPQPPSDQVVRRTQSLRQGPPPEQIELTKKNYRLAKELVRSWRRLSYPGDLESGSLTLCSQFLIE